MYNPPLKTVLIAISIIAVSISCKEQTSSETQSIEAGSVMPEQEASLIFTKGNKITNNNFVGTAYVSMLISADSLNQTYVGNVTFEPGARTNWHSHPSGQIILVVEGKGYYQEKGGPKRVLLKGDAIKCPPNVPHWHGASSDSEFIQLAISSSENGPTEWLEPVSEEEYNAKY
ncbi:cupin domain-containing protein [Arenibacter latericius]|uniref:cupin domain-containing protein n=1 Tax=Arenibacter latericius TaxID=86104 RepID=UPI000415C57E|nr:cupin domain-containing protein [Arenibacter latericius]